MRVDVVSGLVEGAQFVPSPNCDARPIGASPEVIVIHAISLPPGEFGGPAIEHFFCNELDVTAHPYFEQIKDLRVSAHLLLRRDGALLQFVPLHLRAWHAGVSQCEGRTRVNDFSVGIELEGGDDMSYEDVQYRALTELTRELLRAYPAITPARIYGHSDVAPGRKTDPGPHFDWTRYRSALADALAARAPRR
jgi:N-acetyl-anhydromuramoyl-L-alanine amidase